MSTVSIAPHLWRALEVMSKDMNVDAGALCNQAVFAWLRINGYVMPGTVGQAAQPTTPREVLERAQAPQEPPTSPAPVQAVAAAVPAPAAPPEPARSEVPAAAPQVRPASVAAKAAAPATAPTSSENTEGAAHRIAEIEAALERLTKPRSPWAEGAAEQESEEAAGGNTEPDSEPESEPEADADDVGLGGSVESVREPVVSGEEPAPERTVFVRNSTVSLFLERENQAPLLIDTERFVIGRGPQCDLVIDSARVSREHVAITRQGVVYMLEDLGSSNGTWFNDERITSREIENGDVILLGNEPISFVFRGEE